MGRPGSFRILRKSWAPEARGDMLYDVESDLGGTVEVDRNVGSVIHELPDRGGKQTWKILEMAVNPFVSEEGEDEIGSPQGSSSEEDGDIASESEEEDKKDKKKKKDKSHSPDKSAALEKRSRSRSAKKE